MMMRSRLRVLLVLCLVPALCLAQNPTNGGPVYPQTDTRPSAPVQPAPAPTSSAPPPSAAPDNAPPGIPAPPAAPVPVKHSPEGYPILEDGTPIRLSLARSLSSAECRTGDRVDFKVVEPIVLDGITVVPKGSMAWGKIAEAKPKRRMGRGGKLAIEIDSVKLANSDRVRLRAVREATGGGHTAVMSGAMIGTAIVFLPIAPVWLLMHGKEAKIPEGTEITAYTNNDVAYVPPPGTTLPPQPSTASAPAPAPVPVAATTVQPAEAPPPSHEAAAPEPNTPDSAPSDGAPYGADAAVEAAPTSTEIAFSSSPDGAEIDLDGRFMGNTPSTIGVPGGEHTVRISKPGFRTYEKQLHTTGGTISLHADLQAER